MSIINLSEPNLARRNFKNAIEEHCSGFVPSEMLAEIALLGAGVPLNNMGPNIPATPYFVPQCEISGDFVDENKTKIDWCGFSCPHDEIVVFTALSVLWPDLQMMPTTGKIRGYATCKAFVLDGVQFGLIGFGQKHGRSSVSLTGTCCSTLVGARVKLLYDVLVVLDARLSRVDIAFDLYHGELTFDYALFAFKRGDFKSSAGGVQPTSSTVIGTGSDGENLGRTLYIGNRSGRVFGRVYEKGLEVFAKMSEEFRESCTDRERELLGDAAELQGTIADRWLRLEVEYKRKDKSSELPLEMLLERDAYHAGSYPFFADALGRSDGKRPMRLKTDIEITLDGLIGAGRNAFGSLIFSLEKIGFTSEEIVEQLRGSSHSRKLISSGLFSVCETAAEAVRQENSHVPVWAYEQILGAEVAIEYER